PVNAASQFNKRPARQTGARPDIRNHRGRPDAKLALEKSHHRRRITGTVFHVVLYAVRKSRNGIVHLISGDEKDHLPLPVLLFKSGPVIDRAPDVIAAYPA